MLTRFFKAQYQKRTISFREGWMEWIVLINVFPLSDYKVPSVGSESFLDFFTRSLSIKTRHETAFAYKVATTPELVIGLL